MREIVIVTGASYGIGKETAKKFLSLGYSVLGIARHEEQLQELTKESPDFHYVVGDIGNPDSIDHLFACQKSLGKLKALINNAGISKIGLLQDLSLLEWQEVLSTNLTGVFLACRKAIPVFLAQGNGGSIVNISSVWGIQGASMEVAYSASKGGVNALTRALARELAPSRIRVNAIAMGVIETRMNRFLTEADQQELKDEIGMGRFGTAREAADLITDIALHHDYLTGQIITMDGAWI